jgi:PAS domain S-box-containing protein
MARGMNHREKVPQFLKGLDRPDEGPRQRGSSKALGRTAEESPGNTGVPFQTFADFSHDWETWRGPDGNYIYVSPSCERITGYRQRAFYADPWLTRKIAHPEDRGRIEGHFRKDFRQEGQCSLDFRIITAKGDERWINHCCRPVYGSSHSWLGRRSTNRDITERVKAEQALLSRERQLVVQTQHLQEMNAALKVLLKQREEDRKELEETILSNVKRLILPYLARLKRAGLETRQAAYVEAIENHLKDIVSPFMRTLSTRYVDLTPMEIQVAALVKEGRTTKDIAAMLNRSPHAIDFHRNNLRKKIGITSKAANLRSYLLSLS